MAMAVRDAGARVAATATTVPRLDPLTEGLTPPRLSKVTQVGVVNVAGAAVGAFCLTLLLFGRLAPLSGLVGFVVVDYVVFLVLYCILVALVDSAQAVVDRLMTVLMATAAAVLLLGLGSVLLYTALGNHRAAIHAITHFNFYTQDFRKAGPRQGLNVGGIKHAIIGTAWMISIAMVITVPLGLATAIYLNEVGGRLSRLVRTIVEAMIGLPSIIAGLFIFSTYVLVLHSQCGMAAALALGVDMLPIITRSADVVLRLFPGNLREASSALGATDWRTVRHVVLPTARSGLATAVLLGMARGLGETAPVLLTAGYTTFTNTNPLHGPMTSLPLATFELIKSGEPNQVARGYGAAVVLLVLVLAVFTLARVVGGRGPGQLSRRQLRRVQQGSVKDANRIITRYNRGLGGPA